MKQKVHAIAGITAFLIILTFWTSTVLSEAFGTHEHIMSVKSMILRGMVILLPSMIIVGASGMAMGRRRKDAPARAKKKRMPFIAANGLFVLLPAAFFLEARASSGSFDTAFYAVQAIELLAGATNLTMMGLNIRDGRRMARYRRVGQERRGAH